ncbi:MAG TPA: site-2 protease family protein [Acidobacteriaceae bacterium]|jgi:Zn-dependent protease|nr:site-2 protease family protein [Acidobacteriaceae bacterium]
MISSATTFPAEPAPPQPIHNCPSCSHWLPEGTLACPDCQTLTYSRYLSELAGTAQQFEMQGKWKEALDRWRSTLAWLPANAEQAAGIHQHIARIEGRLKADDDRKARWTKRLGPFAPIALFLIKIKSAIFLLIKFKFLLGILGFFGIYWALFGWKFALGFTACIFIHEMGHFVAVKRRGLKADLPMFFPGLGAYVRWYSMGISVDQLAAIALAGPLYGLITALGCLAIGRQMHSELFMVLANVGAWVNFFNLLPLLGLDGAQATYALSRMQRGLIALTCLIFFGLTLGADMNTTRAQWLFLFVGLGMLWRCFTNDAPEKPHTATMIYFQALILALGFIVYLTPIPGLAVGGGLFR